VTNVIKQSVAGLRALLVLTVLLGLLYPAAVWVVGQTVARDQAAGSLVSVDGSVVGSSLLGQQWSGDQWFHGRPSASGYSGETSGGSNLAGSALGDEVARRADAAGLTVGAVPADALTASASGLDAARVRQLVEAHTEDRIAGFLGEPHVDVLELNLALARLTAIGRG
jgi:K+-transporting ATPase ATPase C chain